MAIGDDFSVAANGDIRYTGSGTNYTVIAFHRWLGGLMDDAQAAGNDILDITDVTASDRSTDNIVTLNSPYNIDDVAAQHLYDGSIIQSSGGEIYDGIVCYATAGTFLSIIQNGKIVTPNFWTTALNADATQGISHRFMLKVRTGGADIDGRRIVGQTRVFGKTFSEFKINGTSRGNNVLALTYADDLNNQTAIGTVAGYTTVSNVEGYQTIDVDNNGSQEPYYSQWNRATYTINQLYERAKFLSGRAVSESAGTDTGTNYTVGDGTTTGRAQSFANGANAKLLTRVHFRLKKVGSPTGNLVAKLYAHSGTLGSSSTPNLPDSGVGALTINVVAAAGTFTRATGSFVTDGFIAGMTIVPSGFTNGGNNATKVIKTVTSTVITVTDVTGLVNETGDNNERVKGYQIATSVNIDVSKLTTSYQNIEIGFQTQYEMAASTNYCISVEYSGGDVSNYVHVEGAAVGTHGGNLSSYTTSWAATAGADLWFDAYTSSKLYGITGEMFRGITHEIVVDTPTGTFSAVEAVSWSGGTGQMFAIDSTTAPTKMWIQLLTGVAPTDNQTITGGTSGATCLCNVTVTERTLSFPFLGASTGTALIGGYGIGVETADLSASDKLFDLSNTQRVPPNNVTFTVNGLVSGEDRVLVGPATGNNLNTSQFTLSTTLSGVAETAVVVGAAIPTDTPSSGTIRVILNSGIHRRVAYTSYTGSTFTIASTDFSSDNATSGNNVYISYVDKLAGATSESFTGVYLSDRSLFVRVRDGGSTPIKTFESTGTLGSAGGSTTAIRTADA